MKDQCPANGLGGQYWSRPAGRWGGGTLHYGNAGGDRADEQLGRAGGDRAFEQLGRAGGDRAFEQLGRAGGDRAFEQLGRAGSDRAFEQLGVAGGDRVFDQLDRVFEQQGRAGGDQPRSFGTREEEDLQDTKDNMKAVNITLPSLPPHTGKESGLACGDWLAQVRQLIGDLTVGSLEWWDSLVRSVMRRYHEWLVASPLERLQLRAPSADEYNTTTARRRMDLRTSVLLMNSVPQVLREELIAGRHLESGPILYRILRSYQPGGLAEKSESLQALTSVVASKTPKEAMERLQKWRRHQLRAVELQATLPDPSILCRALGGIVSEVLGQAPQASFRVNSFRLAGMKKIWSYGRKDVGEHQCGAEDADDALILSKLFPDVPHWLLGRIPGAPTVDMNKVPFNRRMRRRIREAGARVLHIFSGVKTQAWTKLENENLAVVCVEIEKGTNFLDDNLFAYLLDMAKEGLWDMILAGPPCRTIPFERYREDGGPRPLKSRTGSGRYGLSWNSVRQQEQCDQDSLLWLRTLYIMYVGYVGNLPSHLLAPTPHPWHQLSLSLLLRCLPG